jgi:hypothetical protein
MENRQLLYFTRIVELGSFTKAAAELHIAQPSLGQQVRNLEEELGTALLVRIRGVLNRLKRVQSCFNMLREFWRTCERRKKRFWPCPINLRAT